VVTNDDEEVAFDSAGERLACAGGDGAVRVWNSRTGQMIRALENAHTGFACSVAFHPEGSHLVSVGADGLMKVWNLTTGRAVFAPWNRFVWSTRCAPKIVNSIAPTIT